MYGLVNKGMADLVTARFGAAKWDEIRRRAGVADEVFLAMKSYPDEVTYRLVGAAAEVLGVPGETLLTAFGEYWVEFTGASGHGEIMNAAGDTLEEFLGNLDLMHARVALAFPELRPPSFRLDRLAPGLLDLHYVSTRAGLAPLVVGLLQGLAKRFDTECSVEARRENDGEGEHDVFRVRYVPSDGA